MIEYPSIINSSKAPREHCVAFDKLDGSNIRAKWTQKHGFSLFGTRTQLIDEKTAFWGEAVTLFKSHQAEPLDKIFRSDKAYRNEREIIVFGEFVGENSFAGHHETEPHKVVVFDILVGHKNQSFVKPRQFLDFGSVVEIPKVIYEGNLNEELIASVRRNDFSLKEGVICKGSTTRGAYRGKIWMCKIKTQEYLDKLKGRFGKDWEKYGE